MGAIRAKLKVLLLIASLRFTYYITLAITSFIIALFWVSPVAMALTCIAVKIGYQPHLSYFQLWLISTLFVTVPLFIIEIIRGRAQRKEEIKAQMKEKEKAIK